METLLSEGFGKPDVALLDDDKQLLALVRKEMRALSEEKFAELLPLQDFQRRLLDLPREIQLGLSEADDHELLEVAQRRGHMLDPA